METGEISVFAAFRAAVIKRESQKSDKIEPPKVMKARHDDWFEKLTNARNNSR